MTHEFIIGQGSRKRDRAFINSQESRESTPTMHAGHLMRSYHEALWAKQFEQQGFTAAPQDASAPYVVPCYYYEPYGMKRWPTYPSRHHYRVDFALVYEIKPYVWKGLTLYCASRWEWVSIKPTNEYEQDRQYLFDLVLFDSRHQRAFQICGRPDAPHRVYKFTYADGSVKVTSTDRERIA